MQISSDSRDTVMDAFQAVRQFSLDLSNPLSPEDQTIQSMPDASPTKWHLAHTSWFFETFILKGLDPSHKPFRDRFEYLFNSYYEGVGPQFPRPQRGLLSRPTVDEVRDYRAFVDDRMTEFARDADDNQWSAAEPLIELGLNHEQQHQELTLTDIKHAMAINPDDPVVYERKSTAEADRTASMDWVSFDGGIYEIGWAGNDFSFDNEGPLHEVLLRPFRLATRPVTNGEFLAFIEDGGYEIPQLWLSDGWAMLKNSGSSRPIYWRKNDGTWFEYTLSGARPVNLHEPVCHVSYYEAAAFAEWAGKRLPSEFEWEVAARQVAIAGHFASSNRYHPMAAAGGGDPLMQMFGDVWEWTSSPYIAYPGYRPPEGTVGEYNGKFMSGQMVLRGGSCATPEDHIRLTYRNFFPPSACWQFSGIRLADDG